MVVVVAIKKIVILVSCFCDKKNTGSHVNVGSMEVGRFHIAPKVSCKPDRPYGSGIGAV